MRCAIFLFYLKDLIQAQAHSSGVTPLQLILMGLSCQGLTQGPSGAPWLGCVSLVSTFTISVGIYWLLKYFQKQILGLRWGWGGGGVIGTWEMYRLLDSYNWRVSTWIFLLTLSPWSSQYIPLEPATNMVKYRDLQWKHSQWALFLICLVTHGSWNSILHGQCPH